ncbi:MAG TPA: hypothetical protein VFN30_01620 [Chitinophagaceae bacterium]|nr:hypothetical protein [Chitinophagaceae bacterium]
MKKQETNQRNPRREFIGTLAGSAALGITAVAAPLQALAGEEKQPDISDADKWFNKITGKHRVVYDVPHPHEIFPFAWPRVFLITNQVTGSPEKDCSVVVVLRHDSIPYAFEDRLWEKYNFSQHFKAYIPMTETPTNKNPFWKPAEGTYKVPGFGVIQIGINELQASGVMFCVCEAAITVHSTIIAGKLGKPQEEVRKDWMTGLLPGIQPVPSGVWALGRAQEHKCAYIFAG